MEIDRLNPKAKDFDEEFSDRISSESKEALPLLVMRMVREAKQKEKEKGKKVFMVTVTTSHKKVFHIDADDLQQALEIGRTTAEEPIGDEFLEDIKATELTTGLGLD